jgi:MoaA/NifB/PqqE/SkfB family radical SAM enzyme
VAERVTDFLRAGKAFSSLLMARIRKAYIPWYAFILITERCNLRCKYCFVNDPDRQANRTGKNKEWSTEETFRVIDELYSLGTRCLNIQGGEPLLRDDLEAIVEYANYKGMLTDIFTNGLLIHRQLKALKKFFRVSLSLEGDEGAHDRDRGAGTYKKMIENIRLLHENDIRFWINYTVSRNNANMTSFRHVLDIAQKYDSVVMLGEAVYKFDPSCRESQVSAQQLKKFWAGVRELKLQGYPIQKPLKSIDLCIETADTISGEDLYRKGDPLPGGRKITPCAMGRYWVFLDVDGTLYPCSNLFNKIGENIFELGAAEAWNRLSRNLDCLACRGSISCGINDFLAFDAESLIEAARQFFQKPSKRLLGNITPGG